MKIENIWGDFLDINLFIDAAKKVNKSKNRRTQEAMLFNENLYFNLMQLIEELKTDKYEVSKYSRFTIYEPKEREIWAPAHRDKIVQIALNTLLIKNGIYDRFIPCSYGSIIDKGPLKAKTKLQENIKSAKRNFGDKAYSIKLDVKKFFYSIDREILKTLFRKHISDDKILNLLDKITDSANVVGETGIPLGNTISQLSSNIYLNELDQYLKRTFSLKYYIRYMDDTFIQVENKEKAREILEAAKRFVKEKLNIELNENKSMYFPIKQCVKGLGFKTFSTHCKIRNRSKKRLKKTLKSKDDIFKLASLSSWLGHAKHANSYNYIKKNNVEEIISELKNKKNNFCEQSIYLKLKT